MSAPLLTQLNQFGWPFRSLDVNRKPQILHMKTLNSVLPTYTLNGQYNLTDSFKVVLSRGLE